VNPSAFREFVDREPELSVGDSRCRAIDVVAVVDQKLDVEVGGRLGALRVWLRVGPDHRVVALDCWLEREPRPSAGTAFARRNRSVALAVAVPGPAAASPRAARSALLAPAGTRLVGG
jgi:hypothetical protein